MDARQALADLMEISSQVQAAVLLDGTGAAAASSLTDDAAATALAESARRLLDAADGVRAEESLTQLEAATREGSVFVVRDGEQVVAAVTGPSPTVGLVFYDLKTCLRAVESGGVAEDSKPRKARRRRTHEVEDGGEAG